MEESLSLSQQQRLQQKLSPLQVKFVRMLEMSGPEVEDEVQRALDDNPALEAADLTDAAPSEESFNESAEELRMADYANDDEIPSYRLEARNHSYSDPYYEPVAVDSSSTLIDTLSAQLAEHSLSEREHRIAIYVIGNLDDNGYITRDSASIAYDIEEQTGVPTTTADVKRMLELVRKLEPAGVGAVDLRDCLLLQLRRRKSSPAVKTAIEIVSHNFDLFSRKHYDKLASSTGCTPEELKDAIALIRTLNPKPAGILGDDPAEERTRHIIPDFSVEIDDGEIHLALLNNIPELRIEETFRENDTDGLQQDTRRNREASLFVRQKRDEATEFIKLLRMRQETLFNVMRAIVKIQRDFFLSGDDESRLKPMILKDISSLTGYDLSVISRATSGKYGATSYGVHPLKMFFNERPKDNDDTSSHEILSAIKEIIANENKHKPMSDEAITSAIAAKGYDIARRTVAKYREKLGIPVARLRKEL